MFFPAETLDSQFRSVSISVCRPSSVDLSACDPPSLIAPFRYHCFVITSAKTDTLALNNHQQTNIQKPSRIKIDSFPYMDCSLECGPVLRGPDCGICGDENGANQTSICHSNINSFHEVCLSSWSNALQRPANSTSPIHLVAPS